jgi:DNA polymerase I-like protein with 3'-5' exonuclease and polymerase domains
VVAPQGRCLLYVDYHAEEIGVAAYLAGDPNMIALYRSPDDIYLRFGAMGGLVPESAVSDPGGAYKAYRKKVLKPLVLGTQYGMQEHEFSRRSGVPPAEARRLIGVHRRLFARFWDWSEENQVRFHVCGRLYTPMRDWYVRWHPMAKSTTLMNWPMQAGAGDILRRAVRLLHRAGVCVLTTLHDAVLVECDLADVGDCERVVVGCKEEASREVLGGDTIPAEVAIRVTPGGRLFEDGEDGRAQRAAWDRLLALLGI